MVLSHLRYTAVNCFLCCLKYSLSSILGLQTNIAIKDYLVCHLLELLPIGQSSHDWLVKTANR